MKQKFNSAQASTEVLNQFTKSFKYYKITEIKIQVTQKKANTKKETSSETFSQITTSLEINQEKVDKLSERAGRFILATNQLDKSQLSSDEMLIRYKEKQAPERGFAFLKAPLFFADSVFLKSPQRVETMALLMGLCLLVYSLGQRELRRYLKNSKTALKNPLGKLTECPTLRWIFQCFQGIHLVVLSGVKQVINLTQERRLTLSFFPPSCRGYYGLSG